MPNKIIEKGGIMKSKIQFINNKPLINVDEKLHPPLAYTTYFDECGKWSDFIKNGYKMFFVNVSFTDLPINNTNGFSPFRTGVFEKDIPDYSEFDEIASNIVAECPDALIFPRINISMPRKWIAEHPYETVETPTGKREALFSDAFMRDGAELLKTLLAHIRTSDYAHRIAGYHLCGGTTQEWFHHDLYGSYSEMGMEKFTQWAFNKYGIKNIPIPIREDFEKATLTDNVKKYYEFCSEATIKTIEHFAKTVKEFINHEQIVGIFYGYNAFVCDSLWGTHALYNITDSPYIDFFSSPCCYDYNRELGFDWGDMLPADSLKLHNKLYFVECDIRTFLTRRMQESRPNTYPDDGYSLIDKDGNRTVWCGPPTLELSISAIRKAFARQVTKQSGIWWFDMWGGWYHHPEIMNELQKMLEIYDDTSNKNTKHSPASEVVVFIDEKAYKNIERGNPLLNSVNHIRVKMGTTGIPFDMCMVEDAHKVIHKYKAAIFTAPVPSDEGKKAIELYEKENIPYIFADKDKVLSYTTNDLRDILIDFGVHCYNTDGCVVYCGNGILGIHTIFDGEAQISLPYKCRVTTLLGTDNQIYDTVKFTISAQKHNTVIFKIENES